MQRQFWDGIVQYFDSDNNGSIDHLEFIGLLEGMGSEVTDEQVDEMVGELPHTVKKSVSNLASLQRLMRTTTATFQPLSCTIS